MTLEELKALIGTMAFEAPRKGKRAEAIEAILKHVKEEQGEATLLQWLLSYMGDAGLTQVGMRIVRQPEPD